MAKISTLTDTFSTIDTGKWTVTGSGTVTVDAGAAKMTYGTATFATATLKSVASYDLTDSAFLVEIPDAAGPAETPWYAQIFISDASNAANAMQMYVSEWDGVTAKIDNNGVEAYRQNLGGGTYSPTSHRWLRIRHASGTLFFETAPNGSSWTTQWSVAASTATWSASMTAVFVEIQGQRGTPAGTVPGFAKFDNVNLAPVAVTSAGGFFRFFGSMGGGGEITLPPPAPSGAFPKLGGMLISGPQDYSTPAYRTQIANLDMAILGMYNLWSGGGGPASTMSATVNAIKAINPDILIGNYTIFTEVFNSPSAPASVDQYNKLNSGVGPGGVGDWWAYNAAGQKLDHLGSGSTNDTNPTLFTTPDSNGDRWPSWSAKRDNTKLITQADFDIWYCDTVFIGSRSNADWNRDGTNDGTTSVTVKSQYRDGQRTYYTTAKTLQPNKLLMANSDNWDLDGSVNPGGAGTPYAQYNNLFHGVFLEDLTGQSWSPDNWGGTAEILAMYHHAYSNLLDPKLVLYGCRISPGDYQTFRYTFSMCLMNDGYYAPNNTSYHDVLWFDEFDLNGTSTTKWLGDAIDPPQTVAWSNGVYRRQFENGLALMNPKGNGARTVSPGVGFRRVSGSQAPSVNTGATVTGTVTLADRDGLILVRI